MSMFGWSYPAGCDGPPDQPEPPDECDVCGKKLPEENATGFCSKACEDKYRKQEMVYDEAYAEWLSKQREE